MKQALGNTAFKGKIFEALPKEGISEWPVTTQGRQIGRA